MTEHPRRVRLRDCGRLEALGNGVPEAMEAQPIAFHTEPVVSLTALNATAEELEGGGGRANPSAVDAVLDNPVLVATQSNQRMK
jgi:hypothetical protein